MSFEYEKFQMLSYYAMCVHTGIQACYICIFPLTLQQAFFLEGQLSFDFIFRLSHIVIFSGH